jgi:hypothetical protein
VIVGVGAPEGVTIEDGFQLFKQLRLADAREKFLVDDTRESDLVGLQVFFKSGELRRIRWLMSPEEEGPDGGVGKDHNGAA